MITLILACCAVWAVVGWALLTGGFCLIYDDEPQDDWMDLADTVQRDDFALWTQEAAL